MFKEIFTWWNKQTFGTRINTILFGKLVGKDSSGNKKVLNSFEKYQRNKLFPIGIILPILVCKYLLNASTCLASSKV